MTARNLLAPLMLIASLTACTASPADRLAGVLPDERVLINMPTQSASAKAEGEDEREWSEAYLFTAQITDDVNGLIGGVLGLASTIVEYPPTTVGEDGTEAVWGPWADALDPVETSLYVREEADGGYTWVFLQRPRGGGEDADQIVIGGEVDAGSTDAAYSGRFAVNFTLIHELNPNEDAEGMFYSDYVVDEAGATATAAFEGFGDAGGETVDALYAYDQEHSGPGQMDLAWLADIDGEGTDEAWIVRSRWTPEGEGRSDAVLTGGSLGGLTALASECWDTSFAEVWYQNNVGDPERGDAAACAYAEASYPE